jgi:membrane-bound lytic murein transglycosylase D
LFDWAFILKFTLRILLHILLILNGFTYSTTSSSEAALNSWDVMRKQFKLNHYVTQPEVQTQLRWLISHPSYLNKLAQSEPYIYHIISEISRRGLPGEIALIPMIESSYDPFAYSGAGAAGLWQLMPGTGTDLGLKQDWWSDARRSIQPSTDAALNYFKYLNHFFHGDWILAVAAYDSGEGTMARIIKNSNQKGPNINFWTLQVPSETKAYVPRLLALAEIIQNPQRYHVQLPNIRYAPYFTEVNIGSQIDLSNAAKLAGISYQTLIKLNPGFNRWATAPYRPYKLLIPTDKVEGFSRNLARTSEDQRVSWTRHQVSAGDNLSIIAQKYHTSVNLIKELNQLKSESIKNGQYVLIPSQNKNYVAQNSQPEVTHFKPTQPYKTIHIVQAKESYTQIEKQYGVTTKQIKQWNNLASNQALRTGQQIVIYQIHKKDLTYIVKRGDSLSTIARHNHIQLSMLRRLNPNIQKHVLHPGQKIRLNA